MKANNRREADNFPEHLQRRLIFQMNWQSETCFILSFQMAIAQTLLVTLLPATKQRAK
jgi:hypothetical protein